MEKVRVAVIGCGSIARHRHVPEYAANPNVELVAFVDPVVERAQAFTQQYGGKAYEDYQTLLRSESLDAVSVCTPNAYHAEIAIAAAKAGCHVLCEKPMAISVDEANEMIQAAKEANVFLMIGYNQRLMPAHQKGKEVLEQGRLGKVISFRTTFGHAGPESWSVDGKDSWFFQKDKAYLGASGDLGVHKIDLLRWLLGEEITEVVAFVDTLAKEATTVDDNLVSIVRTQSGAMGTLTASWSYQPKEDNSTILYCTRGTMKLNSDPAHPVVVEYTDGTVEEYQVGETATNEHQTSSGVIDEFVNSILTGQAPVISGDEGLKSLQVVLAMLESAKSKNVIAFRHE